MPRVPFHSTSWVTRQSKKVLKAYILHSSREKVFTGLQAYVDSQNKDFHLPDFRTKIIEAQSFYKGKTDKWHEMMDETSDNSNEEEEDSDDSESKSAASSQDSNSDSSDSSRKHKRKSSSKNKRKKKDKKQKTTGHSRSSSPTPPS